MGRFFNDEKAYRAITDAAADAVEDLLKTEGGTCGYDFALSLAYTQPVASGLAKLIAKRTLELTDALEKRIHDLEKKRAMSFEGAHDPAKSYGPGAVVQRSGGVFVALVPATEPPGASSQWRRIGDAK